MMQILSFLSILGYVIFLYRKNKALLPILPLFVCSSIIALLYFSCFVFLMRWVSLIIFLIGLVLLARSIYLICQKNDFSVPKIWQQINKTPSTLWLFIVLCIIWFFFTKNAVLHIPDEFFWALYSKFIFLSHGLSSTDGKIIDYGINYPPAAPLFQNFFLQYGRFSESVLYFAQGVITFAALSAILTFQKAKKVFAIIFLLFLGMSLSYFLFGFNGFLALISDNVMGIIFGATLVVSFTLLRTVKHKAFLLPIIFSLALFKENGIIFSLIIALFNIIDLLISNKTSFWKFSTLRQQTKYILASVVIFLTAIFAYGTWTLYLHNLGTHSNLNVVALTSGEKINQQVAPSDDPVTVTDKQDVGQIVVTDDEAVISKTNTQKDIDSRIIKNFKEALFSKKLNNEAVSNLPNIMLQINKMFPFASKLWRAFEQINKSRFAAIQWLAIFIVLLLPIFFSIEKNQKTKLIILTLTTIFGLVFYLFFLLVAYLLFFPAKDAIGLTGLVRYINSYMIGAVVVFFGMIASTNFNAVGLKTKRLNLFLLVFILILFFVQVPPVYSLFIRPASEINRINSLRNGLNGSIETIKSSTTLNSNKIFLFMPLQKTEQSIFKYEIFPHKTSLNQVNLATSKNIANAWEPDISPAEMVDLFETETYQYLFVDKVDDNFWDKYGDMFQNIETSKKYHLFKITINSVGVPIIVPFAR